MEKHLVIVLDGVYGYGGFFRLVEAKVTFMFHGAGFCGSGSHTNIDFSHWQGIRYMPGYNRGFRESFGDVRISQTKNVSDNSEKCLESFIFVSNIFKL